MKKETRFKEIEKIIERMQIKKEKIKDVPQENWTVTINIWTDGTYYIEMSHREMNVTNGIEEYCYYYYKGDKNINYRERSIKTKGSDQRRELLTPKRTLKFMEQFIEKLDRDTKNKLIKLLKN